jgi:hypothetical protein
MTFGEGLARELGAKADGLADSSCAVPDLYRPKGTWLPQSFELRLRRGNGLRHASVITVRSLRFL